MLDSMAKTLLRETYNDIAYIKAAVQKQDTSSFISTITLITVMLIYQLLNIYQFRELKNEIKALKNPAVSAEIAIDKPAESR